MRNLSVALGFVLMVALVTPAPAVTYTGTLTSEGGGLTGKGVWNNNKLDLPTTLTWTVDDTTTPGMWHYQYQLQVPLINHPRDEFKFLRLETSTGFTSSNVSNFTADSLTPSSITKIGQFKKGKGMPSSLYGMEIMHAESAETVEGGEEGHILDIQFDSDRAPTWGDIFARGYKKNLIRNVGFTKRDTDPTAAPSDGSVDFHLLVPDTLSPPLPPNPPTPPGPPGVIPEPMTLLMLGLALVPIGAKLRRRMTH